MRRKGVFRACWESFVPGGPTGARAGRVLYRYRPPGARVGRVLYRRWFRMRQKIRPARLGGGGSGIKLSLLAQNAPKRGVSGVLGEFCTGIARGGRVPGEFCTGGGVVAWCEGSLRVDCGNQGACSQGCRPHGCIRFGGTRHNWSLSSNFACNSPRISYWFVSVQDVVSLVFWNFMRNWGRGTLLG